MEVKQTTSICTSQMLHEWLYIGKQKALMEADGICPCCALEEEDRVHLYHCGNKLMRECVENGINVMERNFHRAKIPALLYIAFIVMLCIITHSTRECKIWSTEHAESAVRAQESLGSFAILRG